MGQRAFIGQVAHNFGVSVQALRYYERLGLLQPPQRTSAGYRLYSAEAVDRLRFIRRAQAAGFHLNEIKEILRLSHTGQSPCNCVRAMLEKKIEGMERQIADLQRLKRELRRALKRSGKFRRLPHAASSVCPIIEGIRAKHTKNERT